MRLQATGLSAKGIATADRRAGRVASVAAGVAMALLSQTPVAVQEHLGRQAISAVELSALRAWDIDIDRQLRTGDLRTYRTKPNAWTPGRRSDRLEQYYRGIPVHGADLNRQTDRQGCHHLHFRHALYRDRSRPDTGPVHRCRARCIRRPGGAGVWTNRAPGTLGAANPGRPLCADLPRNAIELADDLC